MARNSQNACGPRHRQASQADDAKVETIPALDEKKPENAGAARPGRTHSVNVSDTTPTPLDPFQLTGRSTSHVIETPELGVRLHAQAAEAVLELRAAAAAAGIDLVVVSAFRDFARQCAIWNAKFRGERPMLDASGNRLDPGTMDEISRVRAILIWSALPGASRHHWGSDFDVIDRAAMPAGYQPRLTVEEFTTGPFVRLDEWLAANLANHGFFRPYSTDRGGVHPEPWHLSFAPVSVPALQQMTEGVLRESIASSDLEGRETVLAELPWIYDRYVLSVDAP
jgi:LAS superfamily LD-carboxypeptidase LdcB